MIATSLLIQSLSVWQVIRTAIKSGMSSTSSHIRLFTSELLALECWKSPYSHQSYLPLSAEKAHIWPCPIHSAFNFDWLFIKFADNQDSHKFSDVWISTRSDFSLRSFLPLRAEKAHSWPCPISSDFIFVRMFFKLAGYEDSYKILDKFDLGPDRTIFFGVTCPGAMKIFPIDL